MRKIKFLDVLIFFAVIAALAVGYLTYKHFRQTADKQIESTSKIVFQVYLRGVTITGTDNPIKAGEKTFISIRNVPYTDLKILDTQISPKKTVVATQNVKQPFILVDDFSQMFMYDIVVTVEDMAKITKDGAVVGGNKIKIGLPITLEGKDYKFNGPVSAIQIINESPAPVVSVQPAQTQSVQQSEQTLTPQNLQTNVSPQPSTSVVNPVKSDVKTVVSTKSSASSDKNLNELRK